MAESHLTGPIIVSGDTNNALTNPNQVSGAIFGNGGAWVSSNPPGNQSTGEPGDPSVWGIMALPPVAAISNTTATTLALVNVPNIACSFSALILVRTSNTGTSHNYDSTRAALYVLAVERVPGAAAVGTLSSALGGVIATTSGGRTLTFTLALATVTGAVTANNTLPIQITNTPSDSGTTEAQLMVLCVNGLNGTSLTAASGTGVTMQA